MKILIASDLYWPTVNGVATFSRNLARGLSERGHEVIVIAPSQTGKKYREIDENYQVIRTKSVIFPFYQNFRISLSPHLEVKRIIDDFKPDIIHIQMHLMIGQAVMKYGHKRGIPVVSTNHTIPENLLDNLKLLAPLSRPTNYIVKTYGQRFYSKADYVTMPTESAFKMFELSKNQKSTPTEAVSNGINLDRFKVGKPSADLYEKYKLPTNIPIITYIGRTDAEKHLSVLVKAFSQVKKQTKAHLLIVGDGTDRIELVDLVSRLNLERDVTFTGCIVGDDIARLHQVGTVFCMPSPAELQSIATLEAMASGQPIVAVDAGALCELCQDNRNGFLCHKDDSEAIAKSILKIITDDKLRAKFSEESIKIAKTHDIRTSLDRFETIYRDLISQYNR